MVAPVELHQLTGDRWEAHCGGCLKTSIPIPATGAENAWAQLERLGWTVYQHTPGSRAYPKCPACSAKPPGEVPKRKARRHR